MKKYPQSPAWKVAASTNFPDAEGWLEKSSGGKKTKKSLGNVFTSWHRRWFALRGTQLHYYESDQEDHALGLLEVSGSRIEQIDSSSSAYTFVLHTTARAMRLRAADRHTVERWTAALTEASKKEPLREDDDDDDDDDEEESMPPQSPRGATVMGMALMGMAKSSPKLPRRASAVAAAADAAAAAEEHDAYHRKRRCTQRMCVWSLGVLGVAAIALIAWRAAETGERLDVAIDRSVLAPARSQLAAWQHAYAIQTNYLVVGSILGFLLLSTFCHASLRRLHSWAHELSRQPTVARLLHRLGYQEMRSPQAASASAKQKRRGLRAALGDLGARVHDGAIEEGFSKVESVLDSVVKTSVQELIHSDPWAPRKLVGLFEAFWDATWPQIIKAVRDDYLFNHGSMTRGRHMSQAVTQKEILDPEMWPPPPPPCPNPFGWFSCRVLYALFPSDKTLWYAVRHPVLLPILLIFVVGPFLVDELCIVWMLLLACIDRTNEYQLVNYILWLKVLVFFKYGLLPLLTGFFHSIA